MSPAGGERLWPLWLRLAIAAAAFATVLAANALSVHQSVAFIAFLHLPLLAAYVACYRRALSSALAGAGLFAVTTGVWLDVADSNYPDELAFAWLTNAVLWAGVLAGVGVLRSILNLRRRPTGR